MGLVGLSYLDFVSISPPIGTGPRMSRPASLRYQYQIRAWQEAASLSPSHFRQTDLACVCSWHLTDTLSGSLNVRFQGQRGHRVTL